MDLIDKNSTIDTILTEYDFIDLENTVCMNDLSFYKEDKNFNSCMYSDIIDIEFEESTNSDNKLEYTISAFSGIISGVVGTLLFKDFSVKEAHEIGIKDINAFVIKVAKTQGFKQKPLKKDEDVLYDAILFLEKKFPMVGDKLTEKFGGPLQHHLRDFTHHPTFIGLLFSILSQLSGYGFGTNTEGKFVCYLLPKNDTFGKNLEEKILYGTVKWVFHLISDMAGSSNNPGKGTGIPGPILAFLKEFSVLPFVNNIKINYKENEIEFSKWISKVFNGTYFRDENNPKGVRFDLRTEIGIIHKNAGPVIFNECIVRGFYFISKLLIEIKSNEIQTISDLDKLNLKNIIPFRNDTLNRMLTISTGTFTLSNIITAASIAMIEKKLRDKSFGEVFFINVNYVGIGRFVCACKADKKIMEDLKDIFMLHNKNVRRENYNAENFRFFTLKDESARILYSLESHKIDYDIQRTHIKKYKNMKREWKIEWQNSIKETLNINTNHYFIEDEEKLYKYIQQNISNNSNQAWLYLVALELSEFIPYYQIDCDNKYKGLYCTDKYVEKIFCSNQKIIDKKRLKRIIKIYNSYEKKLTNKTLKIVASTLTTAIITFASGGLALYLAPQLAVMIAGQAVVGLHGAALINASLAFVGGGSLAVGGLGMAGGTAILTGGGALLGMLGSSSVSLATMNMLSSKDYIIKECAKLLTLCDYILIEKFDRIDIVLNMQIYLENQINVLNTQIQILKMQGSKNDKKEIKSMESNLKYLKKCSEEMLEMSK